MISLLKLCRDQPNLFNKLFLRRPPYWSRQIDLCRSVVEYRTTVAYSGNMVGKDYWIAGIIIWWLLTRPDALCIITGPSQMVLGSVTFKEIRRCLEGAVLPFGGKLSSGISASPAVIEVAPGWQALGFSTTSVERSSGQHAKHLLTVVEEASGVEDFVFDAIDSLGYERLVCIGNPIRAEGKFVELIRQAARDRADDVSPRLAVNAIRIPSTESPHAHQEKSKFGLADRTWLESMYRKYGRRSLWVGSHIDARIPDVGAEQLIDPAWLDYHSSQQRLSRIARVTSFSKQRWLVRIPLFCLSSWTTLCVARSSIGIMALNGSLQLVSSFHEKLYNRDSAHTAQVAPAALPRH